MLFFKRTKQNMKLRLIGCDYAPPDMEEQLPVICRLLRMIPGSDRPDYWLAKCEKPIKHEGTDVNYLVVAPRYAGQEIKKGMGKITLGVAYVTDESLTHDKSLSFEKCSYAAVCVAEEL